MKWLCLFFLFATPLVCEKRVELVAEEWIPNSDDQSPFHQKNSFFGGLHAQVKDAGYELVGISKKKYKDLLKGKKGKVPSDVARLIFWNMGLKPKKYDLTKLPKERAVLFMWEPPTVQSHLHEKRVWKAFSKVYTWDDDLVDGKKFFKFHYPALQPMIGKEERVPFEERKLCALVATNLSSTYPSEIYSERVKTVAFFDGLEERVFDLYGRGWEKEGFGCYKGAIEGGTGSKMAVLKGYRFNIAYENTRDMKGYVTEKIFDAFAASTVPVYWGASNIEKYVPADCFIDRRKFSSNAELYAFLRGMQEEEFNGYLKRIEAYLGSEGAQVFSPEEFGKVFREAAAPAPL